jgi:hypothetical protein
MVTLPDRFIGIRTAVDRDVKFVIDLAKKFSNQLGFIPSAGLRVYTATGMVALGEENGMPAGYLLGRPSMRFDRSICPITQAAVCFDAQRCKLGLSLVEDLAVRALGRGQSMLQCWCAEDIDAMKFWPAAGFTAVARRNPANARGRWLTLWRRPLIPITRQRLFCPPPVAGFKAARAIIVDSRSATAVDPEMMDW